MNKKLIFSLVLTLLLTTVSTAATLNVPGDYPTIQAAISAAAISGDTIRVADGTYTAAGFYNIDFGGKLVTVRSASGDPTKCIIDCQNIAGRRGFYFHNYETPAATVEGITIKNANAGGLYYGGAIECDGASPTIFNCIITNSRAAFGGAIDCFNASPVIKNCIITNNTATYDGGAIECSYDSKPQIINCLIANNTAGYYGGAIDIYDSSSPTITNCTIANNTGSGGFGGVYASYGSSSTIKNSILWNNGDDIYGPTTVTYSCIQDGDAGTGNINTDPMFRTGPLGNYYLSQISAGQLADSNCVRNLISGISEIGEANSIYTGGDFTTRTDKTKDTNDVDMGFHYQGGTTAYSTLTTYVDPASSGTIDPNHPAGHSYKRYSEISIQATPNSGNKLFRWIDANTATYNPANPSTYNTTPGTNHTLVITLNANKTVIAQFSSVETYKLITYVTGGNGVISDVDPDDFPDPNDPRAYFIPQGNSATITAQPDAGYVVKQWLKGNTATFDINNPATYEVIPGAFGNTYTTTIDADTTITVEFKYQEYLLTTSVYNGNGAISPKRGYYPAGTTVNLTAAPNSGYRVRAWGGDAANKPAWNITTNTVVMNGPKDVNVAFELGQSKLIHVFGDVNGIQSAIDDANDGDTIRIHPGTYTGVPNGFEVNKVITIVGDPENPENVVIDCETEGGYNLGFILSGQSVTLNGITITGVRSSLPIPYDNYGGAIHITGNHTVKNCIIRNALVEINPVTDGIAGGDPNDPNNPDANGGNGGDGGNAGGAGIYVHSGNPYIQNVLIEDCWAIGGNAGNGASGYSDQNDYDSDDPNIIYFPPGIAGYGGDGGDAFGAGIYAEAGSPYFINVTVRNCGVRAGNGGNGADGSADANGADGGLPGRAAGAGIYCAASSAPVFSNCVIENCIGYGGRGGNGGNAGQLQLEERRTGGYGGLTTETAAGQGDIRMYSTNGGAVFCDDDSNPVFDNCTFRSNMTYGSISGLGGHHQPSNVQEMPRENYRVPSFGAGVFCSRNTASTFDNCLFENNRTAYNQDFNDPNYLAAVGLVDISDYDGEYTGQGGGLCLWYAASADIIDCNFVQNSAPIGGGIYSLWTDLYITKSNILNNNSYSGGGVLALDSIVEITESSIKGNSAGTQSGTVEDTGYALFGSGGGIYALSSLIDVVDSDITENYARMTGGGICLDGDTIFTQKPLIKNCLITNNTAADSGGGIASTYFARPTIQNCTIADNLATGVNGRGGGLFGSYESDTIAKDSIFWNNSGINGSQIALSDGGLFTDMPASLTISYSDIQTSAKDVNHAMDVVILIDTTGSMSGVLDSVKTAASDIVDRIAEKTSDYRIAVVDYRDYPEAPYGDPDIDYTFKDNLEFTSSRIAVQNAINGITLGYGGDGPESVFSALMHCIDGDSLGNWRSETSVKKIIILIGDAPGHDPEPYGDNYTLANVIDAANDKKINIYSILTGWGVGEPTATLHFESLAESTSGALIEAPNVSTASAAVIQAIDLATLPSTYIYRDDPRCSIVGLVQDINDMWTVAGSSNISNDPNFVFGYYLSHIATGQNIDSVCIDAGSAFASTVGMNTYTTRLDGVFDSGIVDMGFHYRKAAPQHYITVKIIPDANNPGIHGYITADDPNRLISYDPVTATYTYKFYEGDATLTAVPNANYYVKGWYDRNNVRISASPSYTFVVDSNNTYFVRFKPARTVFVSGGGLALRNAVETAENGDTLVVAAGTYGGDIDIGGKQIKLFGVKPDDPGVVEKTIIDCSGGSRGFIFSGGETSNTVLDGFTIINGGGDVNDVVRGGAIFINTNSSPLIVNVDISNCTVRNANGGAVYISAMSNPQFRNVNITNCSAQNGSGGGVYVSNNSNPIFAGCSFTDCYAGLSGGAIYNISENLLQITDCTFNSNTAEISAGAIYFGELCTVNLQGCEFNGNSANERGGAVMYAADCDFSVESCNFTGNNSGSLAGAIYISANCYGTIYDSIMTGNTAIDEGGAIYMVDSDIVEINDCLIIENSALYGGGIFALYSPKVTITNCEINANRAYNLVPSDDPNLVGSDQDFVAQGGGIFAFASIEKIADCRITGNTATTSGGGIYIAGQQNDVNCPFVFNCLINKNSAERDGGGLSINWYAEPVVKNCTIVENSVSFVDGFGGGIACSYYSDVNVTNSIVWDNIGANGSQLSAAGGDPPYNLPSTINISYSAIRDYEPTGIEETGPTQESIRPGFDEHSLAANDDGSTNLIDVGFEMNFFGTKWSTLYVNNNGNVTFDAPLWTFTPFALTSNIGTPIIAPFFADVDTRDVNSQLVTYAYGAGVINGHNAFGVNWINVGYFASHSDKLNSFQLILIDRSDRNPGDFDMEFNYGRILWETGDASGGTDGFGGYSARAGFSNGTGLPGTFFEIEGSGVNGAFLDSNPNGLVHRSFNTPVVGKMMFKVVNGIPDLGGTPIHIDPNCSIPYWNPDTSIWDGVSHNIKSDPNFVFGYYLSHLAAGQTKDSNCIDAGKETAAKLGLDSYTTSIDGTFDGGTVDMGYHYRTAAPTSKLRVKLNGTGGTYDIAPQNVIVSSQTDPSDATTIIYTIYNGATVQLTAKPDDGFYLKAWLDSKDRVLSFRNDYALTINKNTNLSIGFRQGQIIQVSGGANALRQAVGSAQNGDTLVVAAGTYGGDIDIGGKQIKLFGVKPDDPGVVEKTIIDCSGGSRGFIFSGGETSNTVLDGFTIINGGGDVNDTLSGAAIYIGSNSSPTIVNVDIQDSTIYNANGAAIYIGHKCGPSLFNVNITNCQVNNGNGGAIYVGTEAYPKFTNCSIKNSSAFGGSGGAVYCSIRSTPSFIDCTFSDNSAGISAGAVYSHAGCDSLFQGCKFNNNTVLLGGGQQSRRGGGGGLYCSINNILEVNECDFANNTAGSGGAVFMNSNCSAAVKNTTFSTNFADNDGGAVYITDSNTIEITDINITESTALRGGGIFALNSPKVTIANCELNANRAYGLTTPSDPNLVGSDGNFIAQGGGIFAFASIEKIADCRITGNTATTSGGGIYIAGQQEDANYPQIFNCLIAKNQAGSDGGGISVNWFANTHIQNCTIAENTVTNINGNGGGLYCSYGAYTDVKDTILWANIGTDGSQLAIGSGDVSYPLPSTINISYSDIDLRYTSGIDSTGYGSGGSGSTSAPRLVDEQTIYNEINTSGSAKIIVTLVEPDEAKTTDWASPASVSALQSKITTLQNQALSAVNPSEFTMRHRLTNVAAFSGNVTVSGLSKLLVNPTVAHVEPVRTIRPMLAQAIPLANALATRPTYNGQGVSIAIVDTGVDYTHPRLGGGTFPNSKVIGGYDTGNNDADPIPVGEAHGTACAGIAAGLLGTVGDYIGGVAYGAKIYALKASPDNAGYFFNDATLAAWDWCISHRNDNISNPIKAMSNSWGITNYPINNPAEADALSPAHTIAAQTAVNAGITILAASGNDGFAGDGISWPAAMSNIISVGAVYDTTDTVTEYSNTANILDILAPADPVYTTDIIGSAGYSTGDYYPYFNGTSSACPFAAGAAAALQSAAKQITGDYLTPAQIKSFLVASGNPVTDTKVTITKPRVNLGAAIAMLGESAPVYTEPSSTITGLQKDVNDMWTAVGSSNISEDPNFVPGINYYLSHIDAMQVYTSPCFDIGSTLAANLGLDTYTTRVDNFKDIGNVDLGYHYPEGITTRYELRVEISGSAWGTIKAPWLAGYTYNIYAGQIITFEAVPDANYKVANWFIDDVGQQTNSSNFTTTMDRSKKVSVSFEPIGIAPPPPPLKINVPADYPDLGSAINAAKDGDIIVLARGTYYGPETNLGPSTIWIDGKNITITSTAPDEPNTIAQTIIYGNGFTIFDVNRSMTIEGITIQDAHYYAGDVDCSAQWAHGPTGDGYNGFSILGGAMRLYNASPTIRNCQFINCSALGTNGCDGTGEAGDGGWAGWAHGGAIGIDETSNPLVKNCNFIDCYVQGGDGGDGVNSTVGGHGGNWGDHTSNRWDFGPYEPYWYYSGKGGAIYCASGSKPVFEDCLFQGNVAYSGVSGTSDVDYSGWPQVNYALPAFGGAVYIARGSEAKFTNCTFIDNEADTRGQLGDVNTPEGVTIYSPVVSYGGGICTENTGVLDAADLTQLIENCSFFNNRACSGGGIYQKGATAHLINNTFENCTSMLGGGMSMINNSSIIVDCYFNHNRAIEPAGLGGAIYSSSDTMFYDCQITGNNAAVAGGGAYFTGDFEPYMHNCLITNNNANRDGAGAAAAWGIELTLSNCTLANNTILGTGFASGYGGGLSCAYEAYTKVVNSILWNNNAEYGSEIAIGNMFDAADKYGAQVDVSYSDIKDGQAGIFADTENGCALNWGAGNFNGTSLESPLFVIGPWGNFYLSQTATPDANQTVDSPCVDAGFGSAIDNSMYKHTTRTDHIIDVADSNVDMGYHYTLVADLLGDFNFDGIVTFEDFGLFILFWLDDGCTFPYYCAGRDLNKDGRVDFEDFALFAENYGKTETVPPRPNPMTWALSPRSAGLNSITMRATAARDNSSPVIEYYFECVSGGGNNRGWSTNTTYTDTGLTHGQLYGYRVKARDAKHNETKWSSIGYAVPGEDRTPPEPNPMAWAMVPYATSSNSIRMIATTATDISGVEYYFEETSGNLYGTTSGWQDSPIYEDIGLLPSTTYSYRVNARDKSPAQNPTGYSDIESATTPAEGEPNLPTENTPPTPNPSQWASTPISYYDGTFYYHTMTAVEATDDNLPVYYRFECTFGAGTSSGWQLSPTYNAGPYLVSNYSVYRVYTKDSLGNTGSPSTKYSTSGEWIP